MAQIKFKYNQEWRNLEIPLEIIMNGGGAPSDLENVVITNSKSAAVAFPDLSTYVSDISQIQLMTWVEQSTTTSGSTRTNTTHFYAFAPYVSDSLFVYRIENQANNGTTAPTLYTYATDTTGTYELSGALSNLKRKHINSGEETDLVFNSNLHIYYKGE